VSTQLTKQKLNLRPRHICCWRYSSLEDGSSIQGPLHRRGVEKERVEADLIKALESLGGGKADRPGA
jgi:hypothetical protein